VGLTVLEATRKTLGEDKKKAPKSPKTLVQGPANIKESHPPGQVILTVFLLTVFARPMATLHCMQFLSLVESLRTTDMDKTGAKPNTQRQWKRLGRDTHNLWLPSQLDWLAGGDGNCVGRVYVRPRDFA
jgi:hypothetical protein